MKRTITTSFFATMCEWRFVNVGMRVFLGLLFVATGVLKLFAFGTFTEHVRDFGVVSDYLVTPVALLICVAESVCGVGLILGRGWALVGITLLLLSFLAVLGYGIWLGLDIECGCLGPGFPLDLRSQLLIDAILLGTCLFLFWSKSSCCTTSNFARNDQLDAPIG
jgi:hypothetical protein